MAPNWNGYQAEPDPANPGQLKLVYQARPTTCPLKSRSWSGPPRDGCLYDGSYENFVYLFPPSQNGGNDMTNTSMSPKLNMRYVGLSFMPGAHPLQQGGNGLRMIGGYQSGAILGVDNSTGEVVWYEATEVRPLAAAQPAGHGHRPAVPHADGWLAGRARRGDRARSCGASRWVRRARPARSRTMVNGEQYIATTNMAGSQPYSQGGNGRCRVSAFKLGGTAKYYDAARARLRSSSRAAAKPRLRCRSRTWRRPVDNTAAGIVPANEIWMARSNGTATSTGDSVLTASMIPSARTVPVGTTVTFRNPGIETFPTAPNLKEHCATAVLRRQVQLQAATGPDGAVHVRPGRRVLLQRLHGSTASRQGARHAHAPGHARCPAVHPERPQPAERRVSSPASKV